MNFTFLLINLLKGMKNRFYLVKLSTVKQFDMGAYGK